MLQYPVFLAYLTMVRNFIYQGTISLRFMFLGISKFVVKMSKLRLFATRKINDGVLDIVQSEEWNGQAMFTSNK